MDIRENEKCYGTEAAGDTSVSKLFPVLPNFHKCFYDLIETRRKCLLSLLENTASKKGKSLVYLCQAAARARSVLISSYRCMTLSVCFLT